MVRLHTGRPGPSTIEDAEAHAWSDAERAFAEDWMAKNIVGGPQSVKRQLLDETRADELMVLCTAAEAEARRRSYTLLRELLPPGVG